MKKKNQTLHNANNNNKKKENKEYKMRNKKKKKLKGHGRKDHTSLGEKKNMKNKQTEDHRRHTRQSVMLYVYATEAKEYAAI